MNNLQALAQKLMSLDDKISACMRCGMCQAVCPMFGASGEEADVARGKLVLINNLAHLLLQDPEALGEKLGRCLMCSSCQAACPSGVEIMSIFRDAREMVYNYLGLSPLKKMIFRILLAQPALFNFSVTLGAPFQGLLFKKGSESHGTVTAPMFNALIGERHLPPLARKQLTQITGGLDEKRPEGGIKVAFFPGCVADKMYVDMGLACLKALKHHNVAVFMPSSFACCGIPAICSGDVTGMLKELQINLELFDKADFDYLLTPCASCTSTIIELWPEYGARLGERYKRIAEKLAARTMDINVFMVDILGVHAADKLSKSVKITYHDPCHLVKSLGITREPREVIEANPASDFIEMKEHDRCCGCGGSFTLTHYDYSRKIGQRKRDNIVESGAKIVATSCPACMMQLENMLALNGDAIKVRHTMQIYADSLEGEN